MNSLAEMIPDVTVFANSNPRGLPIANTLSPVLTFEESAKDIGCYLPKIWK